MGQLASMWGLILKGTSTVEGQGFDFKGINDSYMVNYTDQIASLSNVPVKSAIVVTIIALNLATLLPCEVRQKKKIWKEECLFWHLVSAFTFRLAQISSFMIQYFHLSDRALIAKRICVLNPALTSFASGLFRR